MYSFSRIHRLFGLCGLAGALLFFAGDMLFYGHLGSGPDFHQGMLVTVIHASRERLFAGAVFFAFPSHAEGFGFPPLEAMARGVPTICSTGSAMDETVGDAAIRIHPADIDGWTAALLRLASDDAERARLSDLGVERAARFSWPKAARDYVECYRAAFAGNSR